MFEVEAPSVPSLTETLTASGVSASPSPSSPSSPSPLVSVEEWTVKDRGSNQNVVDILCGNKLVAANVRKQTAEFILTAHNASLASLTAEIEELRAWQRDVQEREAACCPEDVGFDELIGRLRASLAVAEAKISGITDAP